MNYLHSLKLTWPLKMDGWNTSFLLEWPIFRCYCTLVSGRVHDDVSVLLLFVLSWLFKGLNLQNLVTSRHLQYFNPMKRKIWIFWTFQKGRHPNYQSLRRKHVAPTAFLGSSKKNGSPIPHGGFLKWWYPQIIHFNRVFHYKPFILGENPIFWKHPHMLRISNQPSQVWPPLVWPKPWGSMP